MKKITALLLALVMVFALCACGDSTDNETKEPADASSDGFKVGLICLHDEQSTYDKNFIDAFKIACDNLGLAEEDVLIKTNVAETEACKDAALDLVEAGCGIIFSDSFGHRTYMAEVAASNPEVEFCSATGDNAAVMGLDNFHNAFASIYEGRFLAGVAAGMKLNEMIEAGEITAEEAVIGYVGAFTYAEVISGYTSFFLGARSVCESATMKVTFTGSWYDEALEKEAANNLIDAGCVLISQHADSWGAPTACEAAGVPNVSYNASTIEAGENTYIIASRINWAPYYEYAIKAAMAGESFEANWTGTLDTDSVQLFELNDKVAAEGTQAKLDEVKAGLIDGSINVFDCSTFTVTVDEAKELNLNATVDAEGHLTAYLADVDGDYVGETNVVSNGVFVESGADFRSAPYFDVQIDGIELLDVNFG